MRKLFGQKYIVVYGAGESILFFNTAEPSTAYKHKIDYEENKIVEVPGYPEKGSTVWRGWNDKVFTQLTNEYNKKYGYKPGDSGYRSRESVKAQAMVESGSGVHKKDFLTDPLQVNKNGDYYDDKSKKLHLKKGKAMTPEKSVRGGLEWWRHKGFIHDDLGKETKWEGDKCAYRDYNRNTAMKDGKQQHRDWYKDRVMDLAQKTEAVAKAKDYDKKKGR